MNKLCLGTIEQDEYFQDRFGIDDVGFSILGQGEYNINYFFRSKTYGKDLVLRVATDSQMDLENQIKYEYDALVLLEKTKRTPRPIYYDDRKKLVPYGFLVMEYLPGRHLDYRSDLEIAARILADIHNEPVPEANTLLKPKNPIVSVYEECLNLFEKYRNSDYVDQRISDKIIDLLEYGKNIDTDDIGYRCIINTELNSGNFLINGKNGANYLVDWEKPICAYPAQDLGHFLAPTTTFWKTDVILSREEINHFIKEYCRNSNQYKDASELWQSVKNYVAINCLRGITWCAMAYVAYQDPNKIIVNEYTYAKIKSYLSEEFLDMIKKEYFYEYE
ncbi:aminoglycoside phosphotransferase family protein [Clostridia bacterium]|nr:aminoglycoside phosphotransferase family protein [Clostridia bacterium]